MAHDFHNVVSAIGLYAELLQRQCLDDAGGAHLAAIRKEVEYGTALVWQVLDSVHGREDHPDDVDVEALLADLVPGLRRTAPDGVVISVGDVGGPCVVSADPTRLRQILVNLVTNATDALGGAGAVAILLSLVAAPADEPGARRGDAPASWVRIDVADTGGGMSPDVAARAFDAFFTTKIPGEGTGLGLTQVRALTDQLGGHVEIESAVGRGTTVSLWLRAMDPVPADDRHGAGGGARGRR